MIEEVKRMRRYGPSKGIEGVSDDLCALVERTLSLISYESGTVDMVVVLGCK